MTDFAHDSQHYQGVIQTTGYSSFKSINYYPASRGGRSEPIDKICSNGGQQILNCTGIAIGILKTCSAADCERVIPGIRGH
jgi:hypothetical protein